MMVIEIHSYNSVRVSYGSTSANHQPQKFTSAFYHTIHKSLTSQILPFGDEWYFHPFNYLPWAD